jgi:hypothetical protein
MMYLHGTGVSDPFNHRDGLQSLINPSIGVDVIADLSLHKHRARSLQARKAGSLLPVVAAATTPRWCVLSPEEGPERGWNLRF